MTDRLDADTGGTDAGRPSDVVALVPAWLANLAALGWRIIAVAALVGALWLLANLLWTVTASIAVAIVVAAFFAPFALRLRARGRSRAVAAGIVWALALVVVGGALLLLAVALVPYALELVRTLAAAVQRIQSDLAALHIPPAVGQAIRDLVSLIVDVSGGAASQVSGSVAQAATIVVLAVFLVFFFLKDGDRAWVWLFQALGDQKREKVSTAGDDALWRVGGYLRGTTVLSAIIALTDYVFMVILGVPLAVPLAVLVFFSGYIPYFGGIVTTFLILIVTYGTLGFGPVVAMLVLIAIRNAILGYGIRPAVYGRTVSIHPALVLMVLPAGFELAGVIGLFAAVPVTAVVLAVAGAAVTILDPGPGAELPALVPGWLDRAAQWSWRLLVAFGLGALAVGVFIALPLVMIPILLATILAATLEPIVNWLIARGRSRSGASALAVGGGFLIVVVIIAAAFYVLVDQAADIASTSASGAASIDTASGGVLGLLRDVISRGGIEAVRSIAEAASAIGEVAVIVLLSTLLCFYFLRDGGKLWAMAENRVRADVRPEVAAAARRAFEVLGGYMIGTGAISLVGAGSQLLIMVVLGIPLALPVFVLSFFLCFIPYIGGFISTGIAFLLTVAVGSPFDIAVMVVWTLVFNIVTGNVVGPLVYGKAVHLHPAVVLVAIPGGAAVAGILGMFIVVPAIGVVAATWRTVLAVVGLRRRLPGFAPAAVESPPPVVVPDTPAPEPA